MIPPSTSKHAIAIVDESNRHRKEVCDALLSFYDVVPYENIKHALFGVTGDAPDLILVGEHVPTSLAINFIYSVRKDTTLSHIPIIFITDNKDSKAADGALTMGANAIVKKPYLSSTLINAISALLNANVEREWEQLLPVQRKALKGTVEVFNSIADVIAKGEPLPFAQVKNACEPLVEAISNNQFKSILNGVKNHDNYTYAHSMRVATMLSLFGHAAGLKNQDQLVLASGGLLHDVGKMLIPHNILNKPGKLTPEEFAIMKTHVPETVKYLQANKDIPKSVIVIAAQHHEKLDGTGYPHGLQGSELNDLARMAAIVDVFSALTDRRVYKPPMPAEDALTIMTEEMGHHLDQHFLKIFKTMLYEAVI
jgi:putative nucleotidyltransferase with HDIG domain